MEMYCICNVSLMHGVLSEGVTSIGHLIGISSRWTCRKLSGPLRMHMDVAPESEDPTECQKLSQPVVLFASLHVSTSTHELSQYFRYCLVPKYLGT